MFVAKVKYRKLQPDFTGVWGSSPQGFFAITYIFALQKTPI